MSTITRIYQGRIIDAEFETTDNVWSPDCTPWDALYQTHCLFQDAVNYHIVALAGMCNGYDDVPIASKFASRISKIWTQSPKDQPDAQSLQTSIARTLNLVNPTFEQAVDAIFEGVENRNILPYVLKYVMESTSKGDGAIQQNGRELLPKLCNPDFKGNFDYSLKERNATEGLRLLHKELETASDDELRQLASQMDLSWAGIKTQPGEYFTEHETKAEIEKITNEFKAFIKNELDGAAKKALADLKVKDISAAVDEVLASVPMMSIRPLAKNNKVAPSLKQCAVMFMYYPCHTTAQLLRHRLPKVQEGSQEVQQWDIEKDLSDDPIIMTRGSRGYVYLGYSALPSWQNETTAAMYEKEWDILAFKEALKAVHGFNLKQDERDAEKAKIAALVLYMTKGEGKIKFSNEEAEEYVPVFKDDRRFDAVKKLISELSLNEGEEFTVRHRTINGYDEVVKQWKSSIAAGKDSTADLQQIVKDVQAKESRFGSQLLFATLCREEYRCIWQEEGPQDKLPRSKHVLRDYGELQELQKELVRLSEEVRVTAAEPEYSPRQLMYSDLTNLGPVKGSCKFIPQQEGILRIGVIVHNGKGRYEGVPVKVRYSAPRLVRDCLGTDSANWPKDAKDKQTQQDWLQPMLAALNICIDDLPIMAKQPAVALAISSSSSENKNFYLNIPVQIDVSKLQEKIGKVNVWKSQFSGVKDELLHLHWPQTKTGAVPAWWENPMIKSEGFSVLGVDLGVRYAAAYSLIHVRNNNNIKSFKGSTIVNRLIGSTGSDHWYGGIVKQGLIKLDGEGRSLERKGRAQAGPQGIRLAKEEELKCVEEAFLPVAIEPWFVGKHAEKIKATDLSKEALRLFRRILSRNRLFSSWYVKLQDESKCAAALEVMQDYFNSVQDKIVPGMKDALNAQNLEEIKKLLKSAALSVREKLPKIAEVVTNSILPLEKGEWCWVHQSRPNYIGSGVMQRHHEEAKRKKKRFFKGGLSVNRIEILEDLRQSLQSMNRQLHYQLGEEVPFGSASRQLKVIDPCPDILQKIENIRETRVNQIAHDIVAQALGVKLIGDKENKNDAGKDIHHGTYERIPNRKPVDFVVLENLVRYKMSTDRTPLENSTLMRWAHRQIVGKVHQLLTEVFGIQVILANPAYTSRFDCMTSAAGFRANHLDDNYCKWVNADYSRASDKEKKIAAHYKEVCGVLQNDSATPKGFALYRPQQGGEFFIAPGVDGKPIVRNADMNASANIAWHALAAPDAFSLLHRLRLQKDAKKGLKLRKDNKREKAITNYTFETVGSLDDSQTSFVTAFIQTNPKLQTLCTLRNEKELIPFVHGKVLWGDLKEKQWLYCHMLNKRLLQKIGHDTSEIDKLLPEDENDDIPM